MTPDLFRDSPARRPRGLVGSLARQTLMWTAPRLTRPIAAHYGETFPFWYISEYPRSGGTWLGRMVSSYLDLPFPLHHRAPLAMPCVVHNHWRYDSRYNRVFYLYRDGRDVLVSLYILRMKTISGGLGSNPFAEKMHRRYVNVLGKHYQEDNPSQHIAAFIDMEMSDPQQSPLNWPAHVGDWFDTSRPGISFLSYEQLLADPLTALKVALRKFVPEVDDARLLDAIDRYTFVNMSGRKPGEEDRDDLVRRKGIVGDWKNHFTPEAAEVFDHHAGEVLVRLGYESDRNWVHDFSANR